MAKPDSWVDYAPERRPDTGRFTVDRRGAWWRIKFCPGDATEYLVDVSELASGELVVAWRSPILRARLQRSGAVKLARARAAVVPLVLVRRDPRHRMCRPTVEWVRCRLQLGETPEAQHEARMAAELCQLLHDGRHGLAALWPPPDGWDAGARAQLPLA